MQIATTDTFNMYYDEKSNSWYAPYSGYASPIIRGWQPPSERWTDDQLEARWREICAQQQRK